jgi:hypothetical protein
MDDQGDQGYYALFPPRFAILSIWINTYRSSFKAFKAASIH